ALRGLPPPVKEAPPPTYRPPGRSSLPRRPARGCSLRHPLAGCTGAASEALPVGASALAVAFGVLGAVEVTTPLFVAPDHAIGVASDALIGPAVTETVLVGLTEHHRNSS